MEIERHGRWSDTAKVAAWAIVLGPATVVLHELGHLAVAAASGLPAQLHPVSVSGGWEQGEANGGLAALQSAAGPAVSVAIALLGALLYARDTRRLWALAAALAAVGRMLVTTLYLGVRLQLAVTGQAYEGSPNFDEHNVATGLGMPPPLIALCATAFLFGIVYWLLRVTPRGRRILFSLALVGGLAVGLALWTMVAPEVLLSLPGSAG